MRLIDDEVILACAAYVDLNPIRAGIAQTIEDSQFTSARLRLQTIADAVQDSDEGFLAMPAAAYMELLDWTARQIVTGKRGATLEDTPPIFERLKIKPAVWCELVTRFGKLFSLASCWPTAWLRRVSRSPSQEAFSRPPSRPRVDGLTDLSTIGGAPPSAIAYKRGSMHI